MSTAGVRRLNCDVLVIGSGASGLAAAVTAASQGLEVIVAEKHNQLGGTSAWSGGWLWVPGNPLARAAGIEEAEDRPARYLRAQTGRDTLDDLQRAYLEHGPQMVEFFTRHTAVQFFSGNAMPDMHGGDGSAAGGRSLCAQPYDGRELGPWLQRLRAPLDVVSLAGMGIAGGADMAHFFNASRSLASARYVAGRLWRHAGDLLRYRRGTQLVNGNALVARLLRSALDQKVTLLTGTGAVRLLTECPDDHRPGGTRISGAELRDAEGPLTVHTRRGVVLACGGFPHDPQRLHTLLPAAAGGAGHCSAAPPSNTGDGLRLGEGVGAQVSATLPSAAAWAPVSLVPRQDGTLGHFPHLIDRAKPGFIAVTQNGERFCNEADCYHDFMQRLFAVTPPGESAHAWLIVDRSARRRYGIGWVKPWPFPDRYYLRRGYLKRGDTLEALARECGIDGAVLRRTVEGFNASARVGQDPVFQRGESAYNRAQGEAGHAPNPSLRALERGPFYAVRLVPGSLGTFAGLVTDAQARVLDIGGAPILGLHAVGNDMNSVMGGHYPSGGITLGPGMTFGYLAGLSLAGMGLAQSHPSAGREMVNA